MDDTPDDRALLAAHTAGDDEAFGILFTRHRDRLWAVALRTTGDPEDAADALQDALISAFRRADSFRGESAVSTWLHRIVVNACLDRLRRNRVRAADPLPDDLERYAGRGSLATGTTGTRAGSPPGSPPGSLPGSPVRTPVDPGEALLEQERRDVVHRALATLPPDQRAALVLVDMQGYPVEEAARILDCAVGTVKSRCHRGRARLAPLLADLRPHHPAGPSPTRAAPAGSAAPSAPAPAEPPAGGSRPTTGKGGAEA